MRPGRNEPALRHDDRRTARELRREHREGGRSREERDGDVVARAPHVPHQRRHHARVELATLLEVQQRDARPGDGRAVVIEVGKVLEEMRLRARARAGPRRDSPSDAAIRPRRGCRSRAGSASRARPPRGPSAGRRRLGSRRVKRKDAAPPRHAVVMAGGAGERFWPRSRRARPKPLMRVAGQDDPARCRSRPRTALRGRGSRVDRLYPRERAAMRRASGLPASRILVEPRGRNTAMAVGWAAAHIEALEPGSVVAVLAADHVVPDSAAFAKALRRAAAAAARRRAGHARRPADAARDRLRLHPARPRGRSRAPRRAPREAVSRETGRGAGPAHAARGRPSVERRHLRMARRGRAGRDRATRAGTRARARTAAQSRAKRAVVRAYALAPSLPIDVAVLERSDRVWTLPVRFHWNDVGTWASFALEVGVGPKTSRAVGGDAVFVDAEGNLVWPAGRTIALLGVEGLAVIDSGDALLVARLDRSGDVRRVVAALRERARDDLL